MQNNPAETRPATKDPKNNKRNYDKMTWTLEEKKVIYYWYTYSRFKEWGRNNCNKILMDKLKETELKTKIESTTATKNNSICSVIHQYLSVEEIDDIKSEAT